MFAAQELALRPSEAISNNSPIRLAMWRYHLMALYKSYGINKVHVSSLEETGLEVADGVQFIRSDALVKSRSIRQNGKTPY